MKFTDAQRKNIKKAFAGIDRKIIARAIVKSGKRNLIDRIAGGTATVSARRAVEIERITFGKIPAKVLRPDIFGNGKR